MHGRIQQATNLTHSHKSLEAMQFAVLESKSQQIGCAFLCLLCSCSSSFGSVLSVYFEAKHIQNRQHNSAARFISMTLLELSRPLNLKQ